MSTRSGAWLILAVTAGCAAPSADSFVVYHRADDGGYSLEARPIDFDPTRVSGDLGTAFRGGALRGDTYHRGAPANVAYVLDDDGSAVALDEDGLVLWSFYAALTDARDDLAEVDAAVDDIFPVSIADNPNTVLDFVGVENAAFVTGQRTFILFPDRLRTVPLAANAGVVRHEFGHAVFERLVTGASGGPVVWDGSTEQALRVRVLNEGFADMIATLSLDAPRFIDDSLAMPSRDVSRGGAAEPGMYPASDADVIASLVYDPYALGTIFASFVWDVREATSAPDALRAVIVATEAWGARGQWSDIDRWTADFIHAQVNWEDRDAACAALSVRFPDVEVPAECP